MSFSISNTSSQLFRPNAEFSSFETQFDTEYSGQRSLQAQKPFGSGIDFKAGEQLLDETRRMVEEPASPIGGSEQPASFSTQHITPLPNTLPSYRSISVDSWATKLDAELQQQESAENPNNPQNRKDSNFPKYRAPEIDSTALNDALTLLAGGNLLKVESFEVDLPNKLEFSGPFGRGQQLDEINLNQTRFNSSSANSANTFKQPTTAKEFNPFASAVYSATGSVASYFVLKSSGLSNQQAFALLPAGFARDFANIGIANLPLETGNGFAEVALKGSIGATLSWGTNKIAGSLNANAKPSPALNVAMLGSAFTVNGFLVGVNELQESGYLGGVPPENPKNLSEWGHKYVPPSLAIGLGVQLPMVSAEAWKTLKNTGVSGVFDRSSLVRTAAISFILPTAQNLIANGVVDPPSDGLGNDPAAQQFRGIVGAIANTAGYTTTEWAWNKLVPQAANFSWKSSLATGANVTGAIELADVTSRVVELTGLDLQNSAHAAKALEICDDLLSHPFVGASNPNLALTPYETSFETEQRWRALEQVKQKIFELHPSLKPR